MTDETTAAVRELAQEIRDWRQGKPPPMDLSDESIPLLERQREAERRGDTNAATALSAQHLRDAHARQETITLTRPRKDGKGREDIRDVIARLDAEAAQAHHAGDLEKAGRLTGEAFQLKAELSAAQMDAQNEAGRRVLMQGFMALGMADDQFVPEDQRQQPVELAPEQQWPNDPLSYVVREHAERLGSAKVAEFRETIRRNHAARAPQDVRARQRAAEAAGDVQGSAEAGAEWMLGDRYGLDENGKPNVPRQEPPPPSEWTVERLEPEPAGAGD